MLTALIRKNTIQVGQLYEYHRLTPLKSVTLHLYIMSENKRKITITTKEGKPFAVPPEGSLGLLALGHIGVIAWRQAREAARRENQKNQPDNPEEKEQKNG